MKLRNLIRMTMEGWKEAVSMKLLAPENWTPLLVYIHTSRLIVGVFFGFWIGVLSAILFFLL